MTEEELLTLLKQNDGNAEAKSKQRDDVAEYFEVERRCRDAFHDELKEILKEWRSLQ